MMLNEGQVVGDYDFKKIRSSPIHKVEEGRYRIILSLFVIEKIYRGLYFKLSELNSQLNLSNQVKDLHGTLSGEFSEQIVVYEILNSIYKNRYITFTGKELKAQGITAEPDYYMRKGNRIFLFESKDFLIKAKIKTSYDYQLLKAEFQNKLLKDAKGPKAILQLLTNIDRILSGKFPADIKFDRKKVKIYPIIIVHDHQYNVIGLNNIVNDWFKTAVDQLSAGSFDSKLVRPLTIINIDTLIYHQDLLRERELVLEDLLEDYFKSSLFNHKRKYQNLEQKKASIFKTILPFSKFVTQRAIASKKARVPKMLNEKGFTLFK
jgi:hypothetical protein